MWLFTMKLQWTSPFGLILYLMVIYTNHKAQTSQKFYNFRNSFSSQHCLQAINFKLNLKYVTTLLLIT